MEQTTHCKRGVVGEKDIIEKIEKKSNPTHQQNRKANTLKSDIKSTKAANVGKSTVNETTSNTADNVGNKDDEKK